MATCCGPKSGLRPPLFGAYFSNDTGTCNTHQGQKVMGLLSPEYVECYNLWSTDAWFHQAKCVPKYLQNKYQQHQQTRNNVLKQHLDSLYTECFLHHLPEGIVMEEALEHVD